MQALELTPQYTSDFISFTNLQREIDEQCLRPAGQINHDEAAQILDDFETNSIVGKLNSASKWVIWMALVSTP